jgi:hypothetical protein
LYESQDPMENAPMRKYLLLLALAGCAAPSVQNSLVDSGFRSSRPTFTLPDLRLGDISYSRSRLSEREALSWHFTPEGDFRRGIPRLDQEAYDSIKVRIYEIGTVENGRYRGYLIERWDVLDELVPASGAPQARRYHHYFLRSEDALVHLPAMARGAAVQPLWSESGKGREVQAFLRQRWDSGLRTDAKFQVPELRPAVKVEVPGEGSFRAAAYGESLSVTETRLGAPVPLASLPWGRELFRVPGDWIVFVYPDGLAAASRVWWKFV